MKMIVKRTGDAVEYSFEDVTAQEASELINIFEGGKTPQGKPDVTVRPVPADVLFASGSKLDHLGIRLNLERRTVPRETDTDFRLRIAKRYQELGYLK